MVTASELPIETVREGTTATDMAAAIFGDGVTVVGASYNGDIDSAGIYTLGDSVASGTTPGDTGIILSTGNAEDFTNSSGDSNQSTRTSTNTTGESGLEEFDAIAGARTFDAAFLDVDFIPQGNLLTMEFVFSSEEYPEFNNSVFQDFVAVWINGTEVPLVVGNGDIDPGNVNSEDNQNLFVDNTGGELNTEMDGLTITLSLTIPVTPDEVNSIRFGIADVADDRYDSSLLIGGDSVQTALVAVEDETNLFPDGVKTIDVLGNDVTATGGSLTITQINGNDVVAGDTITLSTGQEVTLNADGSLTLVGDGTEEEFNFTYTVDDGQISDTGIVNVSSIPCFVAGTMIATPDGDRAVETLRPGDLVLTHDDGPQPVRWAGQRTMRAEGAYAPIELRAGTFGPHKTLIAVSYTHLTLPTIYSV